MPETLTAPSAPFLHPARRRMAWIVVLGGLAVVGSYAYELGSHPESRDALWGGVPAWLQPLYGVTMLLAAAGFFPFTWYLLFRVDPDRVRVAGRYGFGLFNLLYVLILVPSALWMPLTFALLAQPSAALWIAIRLGLGLTGLASLGLIAALVTARPREGRRAHALAVAGSCAFALQTALLDALVWPAYFPAPQ